VAPDGRDDLVRRLQVEGSGQATSPAGGGVLNLEVRHGYKIDYSGFLTTLILAASY
jgi:hypothetical protein